jgi:hypothetical protein
MKFLQDQPERRVVAVFMFLGLCLLLQALTRTPDNLHWMFLFLMGLAFTLFALSGLLPQSLHRVRGVLRISSFACVLGAVTADV